jgi:metallo-beta-lactamase class B
MVEQDWRLVEEPNARGPVPKRDLVIRDGDTLTLGNTTLKAYVTPGHTPGVLSLEFTVFDAGKPHRAFLHGGSGARGGLDLARQSVASNNRVAQLQGIEVGLTTHSWTQTIPYPNGAIFERAQRLAQRKPGEPHPFVDPASFQEWMKRVQANSEENLQDALAEAAAASRR